MWLEFVRGSGWCGRTLITKQCSSLTPPFVHSSVRSRITSLWRSKRMPCTKYDAPEKRCILARLCTIRIETYLKEHKLGSMCQRPRYNSTTAEQAWSRSEYHPICCKAIRKLQCDSWTMVPVVKQAISSLICRYSVHMQECAWSSEK